MGFPDQLKAARLRMNYTQQQVAELLGVTKSTYCGYETGKRQPDVLKIKLIADILQTSGDILLETGLGPDYFPQNKKAPLYSSEAKKLAQDYDALDSYGKRVVRLVADEEMARCAEQVQSSSQTEVSSEIMPEPAKVIPLFTSAAAAGIASPVLGEDYEDYVLRKDDPQSAILAVRVQGDSMEPYFPDSSVVFCDKTPLQIGDIGVFILDGGSLLKQWCVDNYGNAYLFSLNRKRADADVTVMRSSGQTLTCMGRVITHKRFPLPL